MENKETLEEAAENYNDDFQIKSGSKAPHIKNQHIMNHFIAGAKWMAERMYSEKEVIEIVEKSRATGLTAEFLLLTEQFKKK
jgi:hypothetical protein